MNEYYATSRESHPGRAFLGFFITMVLVCLLMTGGFLTALKTSVLKGGDVTEILENTGFFDTMQAAVIEELYDHADSLGISADAINEIISKDTISDASRMLTDAIAKNETVDLSYLKDDCLEIADTTSQAVVTEVFKEFENTDKVFDIKTLTQNPRLTGVEENYNIHVTDTIETEFEEQYGTTTIDLSQVDSDVLKQQVSDTLSEKLYPAINMVFDRYIDEANYYLNEAIDSLNNHYKMDDIMRAFEKGLEALSFAIIIIYVLAVALFLVQIFLYRKSLHRAFRNFSISALVSGLFILLTGTFLRFARDVISRGLGSYGRAEALVKEFMETNISSIGNRILAIGIIYLICFIIFMSLSSVFKRKEQN